MAAQTDIAWCDSTANYWEGCTAVSKEETGGGGCDHCYAEAMNNWLRRGENWGTGAPRRKIETTVRIVRSWQRNAVKFRKEHGRNRRVFVNSISDWLDNEVDVEWRLELLESVRTSPDLNFLLLTKRIGNWGKLLKEAATHQLALVLANGGDPLRDGLYQWIRAWLDGKAPGNVWVGATVVNQMEADRDVPKLLKVPAFIRFLSIEPMLGPIDLVQAGALWHEIGNRDPLGRIINQREAAESYAGEPMIHWVIPGGESGRKARPPHPEWFRLLRDQCAAAGVPFLFKQWGEWFPDPDDDRGLRPIGITSAGERLSNNAAFNAHAGDAELMFRIGKKAAGRFLDGVLHNKFPEAP